MTTTSSPASSAASSVGSALDWRDEDVRGFGMTVGGPGRVLRPTSAEQVAAAFADVRARGGSIALRGAGCSYGDAATSRDGYVLDLSRMNRVFGFDPVTGLADVEPGVTVRDLWRRAIGHGFWPKVVSGTMAVSMGGAAAMNIHGKNNFALGSFGECVQSFDLLLPNGSTVHCTRETEPALFHAAIAGVYLFLSGLVSGYFDNLAVYRQIPARIRQLGWLRGLLGDARADRFSRYVEHNLGSLAGNAFFGLTLGMTAVIGFNIGLPLDIRHVTFAAANFGIAANTLGATGLTWSDIGIACAGITLVGLVNLAVSFTLALLVAMKARRVRFRHARPLFVAVLKRFAKAPLDFVRPPREVASNSKDEPPTTA